MVKRLIGDTKECLPGGTPGTLEHANLQSTPERTSPFDLTKRELQVLALVVAGYSNPEIATKLRLRNTTVKSHVRHILEKLAVSTRLQAAIKAIQSGVCVPVESMGSRKPTTYRCGAL